ncbi:hypothetical protein HK405_004673 [Cladochytrium tenue]|nr:hypothetical protein HK405_004673 [Cladochytrium tenue]
MPPLGSAPLVERQEGWLHRAALGNSASAFHHPPVGGHPQSHPTRSIPFGSSTHFTSNHDQNPASLVGTPRSSVAAPVVHGFALNANPRDHNMVRSGQPAAPQQTALANSPFNPTGDQNEPLAPYECACALEHTMKDGRKAFRCTHENCGKAIFGWDNAKKHREIHNKDRRTYPCDFCNGRFMRQTDLTRHKSTTYGPAALRAGRANQTIPNDGVGPNSVVPTRVIDEPDLFLAALVAHRRLVSAPVATSREAATAARPFLLLPPWG